jgi:hypothetical protein
MEVIAVFCEHPKKPINIVNGQNVSNVKAGDTDSKPVL